MKTEMTKTMGKPELSGVTDSPELTELPGLTDSPGSTGLAGLTDSQELAELAGLADSPELPRPADEDVLFSLAEGKPVLPDTMHAVVFDMDGTLLDSMFIWDTAGENYLRSRGIEPRSDIREVLRTLSLLQTAHYFQAEYGMKESDREIMDGINGRLEKFYEEEAELKPGVKHALDVLKAEGIKMCVATATDRHMVEPALKRTGALAYFEQVFTCGEVGAGKDRPDVFLAAAEALNAKPEDTWVFEDALFAAETARRAGFHVAVVYDPSAEEQQEELKALAELYIRDWEDLSGRKNPAAAAISVGTT